MNLKQRIDVQTKTPEELTSMGRDILRERNRLAKTVTTADELEAALKAQFSDFSLEFPSVFGSIVHQGAFYSVPFQKFIDFRKTQPRIYTTEEQSLKDLCKYPLLLWKHMNPRYDQKEYLAFKHQLQEDIRGSYVKTKNEFKEVNQRFTQAKEQRAAERKEALVRDILLRIQQAAQKPE